MSKHTEVFDAIGWDLLAPVPITWLDLLADHLNPVRVVQIERRAAQALAYAWGRQDEAGDRDGHTCRAWDVAEGFRHYAMRQAIAFHTECSPSLGPIVDQWRDYLTWRQIRSLGIGTDRAIVDESAIVSE